MNQILNGFINFKVIRFAVSYIDHTFVFMQNNCGLIDLAIPFHPTPSPSGNTQTDALWVLRGRRKIDLITLNVKFRKKMRKHE